MKRFIAIMAITIMLALCLSGCASGSGGKGGSTEWLEAVEDCVYNEIK